MELRDRYKKPSELKRKYALAILLNEKELEALERYCRRFKIENKSKFIRETVFLEVIGRLDRDHPTLFSEEEMNRMVRR